MIIFKCEHCLSLFWYASQLKNHLQNHFKEDNYKGMNELYYCFYDFNIKNKIRSSYKRPLTYADKISIRKFNQSLKELKRNKGEKLSK